MPRMTRALFLSVSRFRPAVFALAILLCPLCFFGQTLTGLWTGALSNDSNTIRKDQSFEIALTEYRGKVYGYSRSEFIVDDTLYYILKRVKGTIEGDVCEVTDEEIVSFNFPGRLDKGIHVTSTFRRNKIDSSWYLEGTWKTNATKKYFAVTGTVNLQVEKDLASSKIFPHLEELGLAKDVAFYQDQKNDPVSMRLAKPEKIQTEYASTRIPTQGSATLEPRNDLQSPSLPSGLPSQEAILTVDISKPDSREKTATNTVKTSSVDVIPGNAVKTGALNKAPVNKIPPTTSEPIAKSTTTKAPGADPRVPQPVGPQNKSVTPDLTSTTKQPEPKQSTAEIKEQNIATSSVPVSALIEKSAVIEGRKSEFSQEVDFKSDSLELSLYDNGEIDGDTVTVFMNGEILMARQGLKASAIKKTIYLKPGEAENFALVLFAENLGKYPPNTGLLVVHDGDDVYNLRFSSDFQKSAGIIFRKKH